MRRLRFGWRVLTVGEGEWSMWTIGPLWIGWRERIIPGRIEIEALAGSQFSKKPLVRFGPSDSQEP